MKAAPFTYHDPTTISELTGLLATLEDAKLLAGGQSLMPMLNMRFVQPDHVVDLNRVGGLAGIEANGGRVTIGAMTRQAELARSPDIEQHLPVMREALAFVGHFQTRNRGTIGGSVSHLDPSAELPAIAMLYDAELTVVSSDGKRTVQMRDWPLAYMTPGISEQEILESLTFAPWGGNYGYAFEEFARRHGDFAIVAVGALLTVENGAISKAAIAVAGADQVPYRLVEAEEALIGQPPNEASFRAAGELARKRDAMSDAYITAAYRQRIAAAMTRRALIKAAQRIGD